MKLFIYDDQGEAFYLVNKGMGGFLNPPNDAEHNYSIELTGKGNGYYSLRGALDCPYVPQQVKNKINEVINTHKPQLTEEWIMQCYLYFNSCYTPDIEAKNRNASDCIVDYKNEIDPHRHLAYLFIKEFFPDYDVRLDLIVNKK